jgi:hypothetical protein
MKWHKIIATFIKSIATISITQLYLLLTEKVGKETAEKLTVYIEEKIKDEAQTQSGILATKQDIADLRKDLATIELKLSEKIGDTRSDMIKWMFIFWIGQVLAFLDLFCCF